MTFDPENFAPPGAKIKVIGVGGGGGNAVNTMIRSNLEGVEFLACNTDVQALRFSLAPQKIQVGKELTRGLGAGANPDVGRDAALEDRHEIQDFLTGADMVFITAGMGGGTGTGGASVVAQIARELGALTVAVVTKPFAFEGKRRRRHGEAGIARLRECVDTLITIPNQRLLQVAAPELSMIDAFKMADDVLVNAVRGISDIINIPGTVNVDFADVKTVMSCMGQALMGIGVAVGEKRAVEAARQAISSPLLEDIDIEGATGILINITAGSNVTLMEVNEACSIVQEAAHEDANIIFGAVIDESLQDAIRVTVIATGFPVEEEKESMGTLGQAATQQQPLAKLTQPLLQPFSGRLTTTTQSYTPSHRAGSVSSTSRSYTNQQTSYMGAGSTTNTSVGATRKPEPSYQPAPATPVAEIPLTKVETPAPVETAQMGSEEEELMRLTFGRNNKAEAERGVATPDHSIRDTQVEYGEVKKTETATPVASSPVHSETTEHQDVTMHHDAMESSASSVAEELFESEPVRLVPEKTIIIPNEAGVILKPSRDVSFNEPARAAGATAQDVADSETDQMEESSKAPLEAIFEAKDASFLVNDIDRKINEALELAERLNTEQPKLEDDLDVPAFLRDNPKDFSLD